MKAAGYCRVSTEEQVAEGHSLAAQRRQIRAAAEAREWELVDLFVDAGFTGANMDRPGLQQLLALGRAHGLDVVIITDLDRLSRNPRDVYMMLDDYFAENGLALYAIGQGLDSTTPMGRAMIGIASVFARLERDLLSERTKRGMAEAKAKGHVAGQVPFGWRRESGLLVRDAEQQRLLVKARRLRQQGKTLRAIAEAMGWTLTATTYRLGWRRPVKNGRQGRSQRGAAPPGGLSDQGAGVERAVRSDATPAPRAGRGSEAGIAG